MQSNEIQSKPLCGELLPEVFDKYFLANANTQPFEHYTARTICGRCAVRLSCLEDAIAYPGVFGDLQHAVQGGEAGSTIRELRRRHFLGGESARVLAQAVFRTQQPIRSPGDFRSLRHGKFATVRLIGEDGDES